jgi:hypothetical protein
MGDVPSGDSRRWFFRSADVPGLRADIVRGLDRGVKPLGHLLTGVAREGRRRKKNNELHTNA